jgi:hypothetical protein
LAGDADMNNMDTEYVNVQVRNAQECFADAGDENHPTGASSSSYQYTEGDVDSPYIVASLLS